MRRAPAILLTAACLLTPAAPAHAFDTGPHTDLSRDALTAEGFGTTAADVAVVNNWFVDFYSNAKSIPHSGHSAFIKELLGGAFGSREHWPQDLVDATVRSHFDSELPSLATGVGVEAEFTRLNRATGAAALRAKAHRSALELLSVIGMSLHELQDFYAHSNWDDPAGVTGSDGPDWASLPYGQTPTWYDLPSDVRQGLPVYIGGTPGHTRVHGGWNGDGNRSLKTAMNKDWPGRLGYPDAYMAAYFATRQWLQGLRAKVDDPVLWQLAEAYFRSYCTDVWCDVAFSTEIGMQSGHWQGQGEPCNPSWSTAVCGDRYGPGGDVLALRQAIKGYFETRSKTRFRRLFEQLMVPFNDQAPPEDAGFALPPSTEMQRSTRFARLQVTRYIADDLGDVWPDRADVFARGTLDGQRYQSGEINGHDSWSFGGPTAPFAFIKAITATGGRPEPVTSAELEVRTSSSRYAGTDDDVYVRLSPTLRLPLDKRLYNDFERGDRDTYSLPLDVVIRDGLTVDLLSQLRIEKAPDGIAGGWKLRGVKLTVNGRVVYQRDGIERWLEDDHRTWSAPGFRAPSGRVTGIPVTLDLWDDDPAFDDHGDIHPNDRRKRGAVVYQPGVTLRGVFRGGSRFGGRLGDGDIGSATWVIDTLTPVVPAPPAPTPEPEPVAPTVTVPVGPVLRPDLVVTAMGYSDADKYFVTVKNQGDAAAGPFTIGFPAPFLSPTVTGLAPGASVTKTYSAVCVTGPRTATADSTGAVSESNEANNALTTSEICII